MEEKFIAAWAAAREKALALGIRMRPVAPEDALATDRRFTALFTDEQANPALGRLLDAGYYLQN